MTFKEASNALDVMAGGKNGRYRSIRFEVTTYTHDVQRHPEIGCALYIADAGWTVNHKTWEGAFEEMKTKMDPVFAQAPGAPDEVPI